MTGIRTQSEIDLMRESGKICAQALKKALEVVNVGVTTKQLDTIAEKAILSAGAEISFKTVENYPYTICVSVNDDVVHGIPTDYRLQEGDILGIDIGALYQGWHSDLAETVIVGKANDQKKVHFLEAGKKGMVAAIDQATAGQKIGTVSHAMQSVIEDAGYNVVRALTGHGVGKALHEEPLIPCFGRKGRGEELRENMTIAIEAIYNKGGTDVRWKNADGWTISSADGSLSGLFERTVAVTKGKAEILTPIDELFAKGEELPGAIRITL